MFSPAYSGIRRSFYLPVPFIGESIFISTALSLVCRGLPGGRNDDCKPRATAVCFCHGSEAYGAARGGECC
jgi:hypothetical protein